MKVLIITKDLHNGEDISEHCRSLANYLNGESIETHVLCFNKGENIDFPDEINVYAVSFMLECNDIFDWTMMMNNELISKARDIFKENGFDIVHAHEWSTLAAGIALKKYFEVPMMITIHSTENNRGFGGPQGAIISEMEYKGANNADRIIAPNKSVVDSLKFDLNVPDEKIVRIDPLKKGWRGEVVNNYREVSSQK